MMRLSGSKIDFAEIMEREQELSQEVRASHVANSMERPTKDSVLVRTAAKTIRL